MAGERLFAAMIRTQREHAKLSQTELAARAGVTKAAVSDWESGRGALRETTLERAAAALGLTLREFLREGLRLTQKEEVTVQKVIDGQ